MGVYNKVRKMAKKSLLITVNPVSGRIELSQDMRKLDGDEQSALIEDAIKALQSLQLDLGEELSVSDSLPNTGSTDQ